jgi:hypothetical protein
MFLKYIDEAGLSHKGYKPHCLGHTLAASLYSIKQFVIWLQILIEKVTHQDVSPYIGYMLSRHTSPQTISSSLFRIRGFYDYLHYDKRLKIKNPVRRGVCLRLSKPFVFGQSLLPLPLVPYKKWLLTRICGSIVALEAFLSHGKGRV